jgi:hypothetical protein
VHVAPVALELLHGQAGLPVEEGHALDGTGGSGAVPDHMILGDDHAHGGAIDEARFVLLQGGMMRALGHGAESARVVGPHLGDAVVDRLGRSIRGRESVGLHVAPHPG